MLLKAFTTIFLALPALVASKQWIDSFEQDGFDTPAGTAVNNNVPGPMSYQNIGYYKASQIPLLQINGGGWVGGVRDTVPGWRLKSVGVFKQISVDYACLSQSLLGLQVAVPCKITATGRKSSGETVTYVMDFSASDITGQTFATAYFPDSFSDLTSVTFASEAFAGLDALVLPQFDYNVYEV